MRYSAKVDSNQSEIVHALLGAGADILDLSRVGCGCPDLLVCFRGVLYLLEIKNVQGRNRLTQAQEDFIAGWRGKVHVVRSIAESLAAIRAIEIQEVK
jgi:hypothetical protein